MGCFYFFVLLTGDLTGEAKKTIKQATGKTRNQKTETILLEIKGVLWVFEAIKWVVIRF